MRLVSRGMHGFERPCCGSASTFSVRSDRRWRIVLLCLNPVEGGCDPRCRLLQSVLASGTSCRYLHSSTTVSGKRSYLEEYTTSGINTMRGEYQFVVLFES